MVFRLQSGFVSKATFTRESASCAFGSLHGPWTMPLWPLMIFPFAPLKSMPEKTSSPMRRPPERYSWVMAFMLVSGFPGNLTWTRSSASSASLLVGGPTTTPRSPFDT